MTTSGSHIGLDQPAENRELRLLSVVAPAYNEEETIAEFCRRAVASLGELPFELILVDDGSADATRSIVADLAAADPRIRLVCLSRNFGHQAALTAGLDRARGNAVVTMDSDLQDPPEVISKLLESWRNGADVVSAVRSQRAGETRVKLLTARWFYRIFTRLTNIELPQNSGDFRLVDRRALTPMLEMRESNRFLRGMSVWVGFRQDQIAYERDPRYAGDIKYTYRKLARLAFDGISSFSHVPLQFATFLGFLFAIVAFLGIPITIGFRIAGQFVPGITTVLLTVLLLGGIQLITVGLIGEYVGRLYDEAKHRPLYIVSDEVNAPADLPADEPAVLQERRPAVADAADPDERRAGTPSG